MPPEAAVSVRCSMKSHLRKEEEITTRSFRKKSSLDPEH